MLRGKVRAQKRSGGEVREGTDASVARPRHEWPLDPAQLLESIRFRKLLLTKQIRMEVPFPSDSFRLRSSCRALKDLPKNVHCGRHGPLLASII